VHESLVVEPDHTIKMIAPQPNEKDPPGTSPSLLAQIRSATRDQHDRAERLVGLPSTLFSHIQTLKTFYGFIMPWESRIGGSLASLAAELLPRQKAPLLVADLKFLGVPESAIASIARCRHLPPIQDVPTALGSMYVFEGATLGGQVLSRRVEQHLGLSNGEGYSFYQSYGPRVGIMWRDFGQLLLTNTPSESFGAAVQSAFDTFACLGDWFELDKPASSTRAPAAP
jgi:heme oxygenase